MNNKIFICHEYYTPSHYTALEYLAHNKGYGTKKHIAAIKEYGITKYHRLSYKPVSDYKDKVLD